MSRRGAAALTAVLALAACSWGMRVEQNPVSSTPAGIRLRYHVRGEKLDRSGELFAVDSSALLVRGPRHLARVSWGSVEWLASGLGADYDLGLGSTVDLKQVQRLTLVSRFPQGLDGDLLRRVLVLLRQDSLDLIR